MSQWLKSTIFVRDYDFSVHTTENTRQPGWATAGSGRRAMENISSGPGAVPVLYDAGSDCSADFGCECR